MIALKHVLVATDFSEPSQVALAYGRSLARTFGATLHILHVVESLNATAGVEYFAASLPGVQASLENAARNRLDGLLSVDETVELRAQKAVRTWGSPAPAIIEYAEQTQIDLIVMGTHGRNALTRFLMGSVAERVVRTAPCPVLTVRHPERDFVAPEAVPVAS